ncbi:uncharacterized protein DFL_005773 [Arthrobotrys flagrans]|uniref:Uncharacterized protein n=1 Tax=Arthrobotrys flagrans TaxID=97331 RepID=A0A436ZZA2_ARTFL|nr:hypothetical protein DFL_005773 [Arthrobotrys flagrans]
MHFSSLLTTATVALVGLSDLASGHLVIMDAWGSNQPKIHGYGLGFSQKNDRKDPFGRILDVPVFDRTVIHDRNNATYLQNGCGFSGNSVGFWYKNNKLAEWNAQKRKKFFFEHKANPVARIIVPKHVEALSLQEGQGRTRKRFNVDKSTVKTGIPKVAAGKTLVVLTRTLKGVPRLLNCRIDYKGTGQSWTRQLKNIGCAQPGQVVTPGCSPAKLSKVFNKFKFQLPADLNCRGTYGPKGGVKNICIVRCQEGSLNGPFGGCIPIQQRRPAAVKTVVVTKTVSGKVTQVTQFVARTTKKLTVQPVKTVTQTVVDTITQRPQPTKTVTVRVITVTKLPYTYTVYVNGKQTTTKATKTNQVVTETITITKTAKPVIETVTVIQKDEFEDEIGGGDDIDDSDPDLEDQPEDDSNDIPIDADDEGPKDDEDDGEDDDASFELDEDTNYYRKLRFRRN